MELFKSLALSPTLHEKLVNQYAVEVEDRGPNLWSVYSALTYYSSHNQDGFAVKERDGSPSSAATMFKRETEVAKWVRSAAFKQLEKV